jgi:hypothetical protein
VSRWHNGKNAKTSSTKDNIIIAVRGYEINRTCDIIQNVLNQLSNWANEEGLKFNIGKSHSLLFARDKNISLPPLKLNNQTLSQKTSVKYLGVLMDEGLKWNEHFNQVVEKAKKDMTRINIMLSKVIGPSPKLTHWV